MNMCLADVISRLGSGATTSEALVDTVLDAADPLGAVERRVARARSLAQASDARRRGGRSRGVLDGVPFGVKGNLDIQGEPTTCGLLDGSHPASSDARSVALLVSLGAIPTVVTTMAPVALGVVTVHPHRGVCRSPRDESRHAGGSSGGSAAAVGSGLVPFALGSDTLGSVRIPAAYCGVVGWIPTHGAVSTRGLVPLAPPLDTVGILAACAADLELLARPLLHPDDMDPWWRPAPAPVQPTPPRVAGCTLTTRADEAARSAAETVIEAFVAQGAVRERTVDFRVEARELRRHALLLVEVCAAATFRDQLEAGHLPASTETLVRYGAQAPATKLWSAVEQIVTARRLIRLAMLDVDYLIVPTAPQEAPHIDDFSDFASEFTAWVNAAGLPCVAVPVDDRSVQIIGPPGSDLDLIRRAGLVSDQLSNAGGRRSRKAETPS